MVRSGDNDHIPSEFVANSFSQVPNVTRAPWNIHGDADWGLEVGGGVGGGLQGPSPTLHVGLTRGNNLGMTGCRGLVVGKDLWLAAPIAVLVWLVTDWAWARPAWLATGSPGTSGRGLGTTLEVCHCHTLVLAP
jgi:hypothetical protein